MMDAAALHAGLVTIDTHVDIPWPPGPSPFEDGPRRVDLPKMRRGGLGAVCFAAYLPQGPRTPEGHQAASARALAMLDAINGMAGAEHGARVCETADAIEAAKRDQVLAIIPAVENGYAMGEDLGLLAQFRARGARYLTLTHNGHNALSDSSNPRRDLGDGDTLHDGLSPLGHEAVAELNRLGMLVDVSHVSLQGALQAARISRTPVLATHSCMQALCNVPRNASDMLLDALRDCGGMVNVTAVPSFLKAGGKADQVTVADYVDHIDYAVKRIGLAHVGISSDFDGGGGFSGWHDAGESGNMTAELVKRGYDAAEIAQLWGGNFLRLLRVAEDHAA
ncbi:MAG: dipeptidase [Janthinobacterium lividum]